MAYSDYIKNFNIEHFDYAKTRSFEQRKVPLWLIPDNEKYADYDSDNSMWLEEINKKGEDELENLTLTGKIDKDIEQYAMNSKMTSYTDNTIKVENSYKKYLTTEKYNLDSNGIFVTVKNNTNNTVVAEKIYNTKLDEGRKIIYNYGEDGNNKFTVVRFYSYNPSKNSASDTVNFMYTSKDKAFLVNTEFEGEFYLLNGKEVKAKKIAENQYKTRDEKGKVLIFYVK